MYGGQSSEGFLVDHYQPINDIQESGFLCASPKENHTMIRHKGGVVVRTLASHKCSAGSNPGAGMWVEFVVGSLSCCERFFSGYSGFPLSPKTNISKFQFDQESGRRRTTSWMCYLQIIIHYSLLYHDVYLRWSYSL